MIRAAVVMIIAALFFYGVYRDIYNGGEMKHDQIKGKHLL